MSPMGQECDDDERISVRSRKCRGSLASAGLEGRIVDEEDSTEKNDSVALTAETREAVTARFSGGVTD